MNKADSRFMLNDWYRADTLGLLEKVATSRNISWPDVMLKFGLPLNINEDADATMPYATLVAMFEYLSGVLDDDALIFDLAHTIPVGYISTFDYVLLCAPTLRVGLQNWERFISIRTNCYTIGYRETTDNGIVEWHVPDRFGPSRQVSYGRIAWAASRIEAALEKNCPKIELHIMAPAPQGSANFLKHFEGRIKFNQDMDRILICKPCLDRRPPHNEDNLYALIEQAALREQKERGQEQNPLNKISEAINENLKAGTATLDKVADTVGMSPRTLQRFLEAQDTTFRKLTENIRKSMASRYLGDTNLPMKEIAFLLGFSELSAFSRAVKLWFGVSPKALRQNPSLVLDRETTDL